MEKPVLFELEPSWKRQLEEELHLPYISSLASFVEKERSFAGSIYPPRELVFNAFWKTPFDKVKIVILGQDPYHRPGQAHGLSFSVPKGTAIPPSLQNIYKELHADLGLPIPTHGSLIRWAEQGVLLLNSTLTVQEGKPLSHHGQGWERFTDAVISKLGQREDPVIFLLWGKVAEEKCGILKGTKHPLLKAPHPSPFSAHQGFLGCKHFSQANRLLKGLGKEEINWEP